MPHLRFIQNPLAEVPLCADAVGGPGDTRMPEALLEIPVVFSPVEKENVE